MVSYSLKSNYLFRGGIILAIVESAQVGSGPSAGGIGWIDWGNFTLAPGETKQGVSVTLLDGSTMTFDITNTTIVGSGRNITATVAPSYPGASFGVTGYTGIIGNVVLYTDQGSTYLLDITISNIQVTDVYGDAIDTYYMLMADGETTDTNERIQFTTDGSDWSLLINLPPVYGSATGPEITGEGTPIVTLTGYTGATTAPVFITQSPTTLSASLYSGASGREGVVIGTAINRLSLGKNIVNRYVANDQFRIGLVGSTTVTTTTYGAIYGPQPIQAVVYGEINSEYTLVEGMEPESPSDISAYNYKIDASNATPGGTTINQPPGYVFALALGDNIACTITNQVIVPTISASKQVNTEYTDFGDELFYTVTLTNNTNLTVDNVNFTDTLANTILFVPGSLMIDNTSTEESPLPPTGAAIGSIAPSETVIITFLVDVTGNVPVDSPSINNKGSIHYTYHILPSDGATQVNTNAVVTTINNATVIANKRVNIPEATRGDTLTYAITVNNLGTTTATNVLLKDTLSSDVTFVEGSLKENTVVLVGEQPSSARLNDIGPGGVSVVTFEVVINQSATSNNILNTGSIDYGYTINPTTGRTISAVSGLNTVSTSLNYAEVIGTKLVNKQVTSLGDTVTYTIVLTNEGTTTASNIMIVDTIPVGSSFIINSVAVDGQTLPGAVVYPPSGLVIDTLGPQVVTTVTYNVTVVSIPTSGVLLNNANICYRYNSTSDASSFVDQCTVTNQVQTQVNSAVLQVAKTVDKETAFIGDILTYTIGLLNTGNVDANQVTFQDATAQGVTYIPDSLQVNGVLQPGANPNNVLQLGTLAPQMALTVTFQVTVVTTPLVNPVPNSALTTYNYLPSAQSPQPIDIKKSSNIVETYIQATTNPVKGANLTSATVGDTMVYGIQWVNTLTMTQDNIVFIDTLPQGVTFVPDSIRVNGVNTPGVTITPPDGLSLGSLAPEGIFTVTFKVVIDTVPVGGKLSNAMVVNYVAAGRPFEEASNTMVTQVNLATLTNVTKQVDKQVVTIGDVLTYTVKFKNSGNVDAIDVVLTDTLPLGTSFIPNTVTINGVAQQGAIVMPPSGLMIGTIPVGQTVIVTYQVDVTSLNNEGLVQNTATLDYSYVVNPVTHRVLSSDVSTNQVSTQVNAVSIPNPLKSVDKNYATVNDTLTYSIFFNNLGNITAQNVVLVDSVPQGTTFISDSVSINGIDAPGMSVAPPGLSLQNLGPGQGITVAFEVRVNQVPNNRTAVNQGRISYQFIVDPSIGTITNGAVLTNTQVTTINYAHLSPSKTVDKAYATIGDTLTYTLYLSNSGNDPAFNTVIIDTIPNGIVFVEDSVTVNNIAQPGQTIQPPTGLNIGRVEIGKAYTITYQAVVTTLPMPNVINNVANVAYNYFLNPITGERINANELTNSATTTVNVTKLQTTKSVNEASVNLGNGVIYTIEVNNLGNISANNVVIYDTIPQGVSFVANSVAVNGVTLPGQNPQTGISVGTLDVGGSGTITFGVTAVSVPTPNPTNNSALASYTYSINPLTGPVLNGTSQSNTVATFIIEQASLVKSVSSESATLGDTLTYTIMWENTLNQSETQVVITDTIPNNTTFVPNSITVNGMEMKGATITPPKGLSIGSVLKGETLLVTYQVVVETLPETNPIYNQAIIRYTYIGNDGDTIVQTNASNVALTEVNIAYFEVSEKFVDKAYATVQDTLTYTVVLANGGNVPAQNVQLIDTLPDGVAFIPNSVTINGKNMPSATVQPPGGLSVGTIPANQMATITYQVTVVSIPSTYQLLNNAQINFNYLVNTTTQERIAVEDLTNTVTTTLNAAVINGPLKLVDKKYATVPDTLTYTVVLMNTGNVVAHDVVVVDTVPTGTTFVKNSITVNGIGSPGTVPEMGILVGDMQPNAVVTITFKVNISQMPTSNLVLNNSEVSYNFITDPNCK